MILPARTTASLRRGLLHARTAVLAPLARSIPSNTVCEPCVGLASLRRFWHRPRWWIVAVLGVGVLGLAATYEARTSAIQAWVFTRVASHLTYAVQPGPSTRLVFPEAGPLDARLGYTRIADFQRRLQTEGFVVSAQTAFSDTALRFARWGVPPPYREAPEARLLLRDHAGMPFYRGAISGGSFRDLAELPPLVAATLLFIENRRLQEPADPRTNPVVDWPRLAKAAVLYAGRQAGWPLPVEGGSTLATQLEKFQHSPQGSTGSAGEKLRQMVAASLKAYRRGEDTRAAREDILLQYLNALPLAAAPGWGEIHGLGAGLRAWFGLAPAEAMQALAAPTPTPAAARAYKAVLALLCATRAPTHYLVRDRQALEARVAAYLPRLVAAGLLTPAFAARVQAVPIGFVRRESVPPVHQTVPRKAVAAVRTHLGQLLGEGNRYALDRLHLEADTTIDQDLQEDVAALFANLRDPAFLARHGLLGDRLLGDGDPREVLYSFLLLERTPLGDVVRTQTDTLARPFDLNDGLKMDLGSTAKLRVVAHYLEVMADLHETLTTGAAAARVAGDPLTRWAATTLRAQPGMSLEAFLRRALDRTYAASPAETFFTGGGTHTFANYAQDEDTRVYSVREALIHSVNLTAIRLMRDLVRFHIAHLPYDAQAVLAEPDHPTRARLLAEIADRESQMALAAAYRAVRGLPPDAVERRLLGRQWRDPHRQAILFFAWHPGANDSEALAQWLATRGGPVSAEQLRRWSAAYGRAALTVADFAALLRRDALELWVAGEVVRTPAVAWEALLARSAEPRRLASAWLLRTRHRTAQDRRLRTRIEQDAFARMAPAWRRLGFPFDDVVPSLATALGSSGDRPRALAELLAIIQHDGVRMPVIALERIRLGGDTPYETRLERPPARGTPVMRPAVAKLLRDVLRGVVQEGTARRVAGTFTDATGSLIPLGGKTGSGDHRVKRVGRGGSVLSTRAVNRAAAFAFYLGDRHVGVITALVPGGRAKDHRFTSALPVTLLRLLAPALEQRLGLDAPSPPVPLVLTASACTARPTDPALACPAHATYVR